MPLRTANIIGSGPNGLAAAITLAERGVAVTVFERSDHIGGACTTAELTLPGFRHDLGSSVYPLGVASPFFRSLPLADYGLRWIEPEFPAVQPLLHQPAAVLGHDLQATAAQFAQGTDDHDVRAWRTLFASSVRDFTALVEDSTRPLLRIPSHPVAMATFGTVAFWPAKMLAKAVFRSESARVLFAGCAGHAVLPLTHVASSAVAVVLASAAHTSGWPVVAGGAQRIPEALTAYLRDLGGAVLTGHPVRSSRDLPPADVTLFDTSVQSLLRLAGDSLSPAFRSRLTHFRPGPGIFKIDYALSEPIPWRDPACKRTATVHLGATLDEMSRSEAAAFAGRLPTPEDDRPYLILTQPSLFDPTRAPAGKHTAWVYCHVPSGSTADRTGAIESQIERFAPGFRDVVLKRRAWNSEDLATWNPNLIYGDVSGGAMTVTQLVARPTLRTYRTSNPRVYLCSASTPPGGGVHGMCGHNAALAALQDHHRD